MMIKAFLILMLGLATVDYVATGGSYVMMTLGTLGHFFGWLTGAGKDSIFTR